MKHRHYCTYFDHRYLKLGLALHESLERVCQEFTLWVLALDAETAGFLEAMNLPSLRVVWLTDLEGFDPELKAIESTRTRVEYYFTCSPCLPRYLMSAHSLDQVTYLDSDLWFFSDPEPLFNEVDRHSIAIIPHRFAGAAARTHAKYGRYNVGWLTFSNDDNGRACLEWWRSKCVEWCFDRVEANRYADQKYLEEFSELFSGVFSIKDPGANLAPWNLSGHQLTLDSGKVLVDGHLLMFFHFQGLRLVAPGSYDTNLSSYGVRLSPLLREAVFEPYLRALARADAVIMATMPSLSGAQRSLRRADLGHWRRHAASTWRTLRARMTGTLINLDFR
jgi:hypothetical protein